MTTPEQVKATAEQAEQSPVVERLARVGLAARTLVWTVLGVIVLRLALGGGGGGEQADQSGALKSIAATPFGGVLIGVLALGFAIWAGYRLLCAAVGHRDEQGAKRHAKRAQAAGEAVVYAFATVTALRVLTGGRADSEEQTGSFTADVMAVTGGRTLIGLAGVTAVVVGAVLAWRAVQRTHSDKLEHYRVPQRLRGPAVTVGVVGLVGRAAVVALVGVFLVVAAVRFDPEEAKGLDGALRALAEQPFGSVLLGLAAVGVLGYALWSLVETLWRDI